MSNNQLDFIKPLRSFRYSVNIRFDHGDIKKINSFIPTSKSIELFNNLYHSFNTNPVTRAHILVGAYGTGKSLFGNILATILSNKESLNEYEPLLQKIKKFNQVLSDKLEKEITKKDPYLIVLPNTDNNFKQSMLFALRESIDKAGLQDIFPETYFISVIESIEHWDKEYPDTYKSFEDMLNEDLVITVNKFIDELKNFNQDSYNYFINAYPLLTSGGEFNPLYNCNLNNVYMEVGREIRRRGYQGIYIIFDEFNKLLENNMDTFNGKELQDFAEMTTRSSENEIHLLLISHKNLLQYTTDLPKEQVDEWRKIEGRFKILDASQYSTQVYELMSNVIHKEGQKWEKFKAKYKYEIENYVKNVQKLKLQPDYGKKEIDKYLVKGCYPMHPITTILLPKLSQRIAQNERTIFTYLSTDDENTLVKFLNKNEDNAYPLIRPSGIYNYFEDLMRQELDFTQIHHAWADTQRALQKLSKDSIHEREFIKTLGIINAVNTFSEIPPSKEIMKFALDNLSNEDFDLLVNWLIEKKIVLYRKSIDHFVFFEGSEIDFVQLIEDKKEEFRNTFSGKYLLNDYFKPAPILPKHYNNQYKIWRYFVNEYLYYDEFKTINDWEEYLIKYNNYSYLDGIIVFLILHSKKEISLAKEKVLNTHNERVIFVIPKKPVNIDEDLLELDAIRDLLFDEELMSKDSFAKQELKSYLEESMELIDKKLNNIINPNFNNTRYYCSGEAKNYIKSRRDISELISTICFRKFDSTPIINNELIVKNTLTSPQRNARESIIEAILFSKIEKRLYISGYGPEFLIYRTFLLRTNLLVEVEDNFTFNPRLFTEENNGDFPEINPSLHEVLNITLSLFNNEGLNNIGEIYHILRKPPFGVRLGIMPLIIAVAARISQNLSKIVIRHNGEETIINAKLFEEINKFPNRYTIEVNEPNLYKDKFVKFLEKEFVGYIIQKRNNEANQVKKIYKAVQEWYQTLPKYARETNSISQDSILLRNIISKRTNEVNKLIFDVLPNKLLGNELNNDDKLISLKEKVHRFKVEEEESYNKLINKILLELRILFYNDSKSLSESINRWYLSLSEKAKNNTYNNEVNSFLNVLRKNSVKQIKDNKLIQVLSITLTGFSIEDWNDKTLEEFLKTIKDIKVSIEHENNNETVEEGNYEFIIKDKSGKEYKRTFDEVKITGLAKILDNRIRNSFNDIGSSVSDKEKQQIIINVLKDMFEEKKIV